MSNCLIKHISKDMVFDAFGNSGGFFLPHESDELPPERICQVALQENREVYILSEEHDEPILVYC